jgi:hypothetical protein
MTMPSASAPASRISSSVPTKDTVRNSGFQPFAWDCFTMGTTVFEGPHYHHGVRFCRTHRINRSADLRGLSLIRGYANWLGTVSFQCRLYSL